MSQHDYDLANASGSAFRTDLNSVLAAIMSLNSGGTEPADTVAYMMWADTSSGLLKIRNAANNAWVDGPLLSNFALPSVQKQLATAFTTTGTSTAYLLTPAPAISANTANTRFRVAFHTAPGAMPTMAVSGLTALPLKYKDSAGAKQAITATQVPSNWVADVETDGTDWLVLNIAPFSNDDITLAAILALIGYTPVSPDVGVSGVGSFFIATVVSNVASGATCAASNLRTVIGDANLSLTGTWRNIGGITAISTGDYGYPFQRVA